MKRLSVDTKLIAEIVKYYIGAIAVVVGMPALLIFALWLGENVI